MTEKTTTTPARRARRTAKPLVATPTSVTAERLAAKSGLNDSMPDTTPVNADTHVAKKPARKAPVKKATTTRQPIEKKGPKAPIDFDARDWTYIAEKDPSDLHVTLAKLIGQRADIEITAKQVQAVLSMHPHFQRSKHNKTRAGYVPLADEIVHQRSVHMVAAHKDAREEMDAKVSTPAKKTAAKRTAKRS